MAGRGIPGRAASRGFVGKEITVMGWIMGGFGPGDRGAGAVRPPFLVLGKI